MFSLNNRLRSEGRFEVMYALLDSNCDLSYCIESDLSPFLSVRGRIIWLSNR